jgi:hypothetical protein
MHKNILATLCAGLLALLPVAAGAQELTPEQVRLSYSAQGYIVDAPTQWTTGVTMLAIHAPHDEQPGWPAMRAFVFAEPVEQSYAQLLAGYSAPIWLDNVAVVRHDPTAFPVEPDCRPTPVEIRS